jgi:ornithine cyclodeaminase/alanine dehydrogenase-like protein (mu-crystallin family)
MARRGATVPGLAKGESVEVLVLDQRDVARLLPMEACMEAMADALAALARDQVLLPLRTVVWLPDRAGALAAMPSAHLSAGVLGVKVITVFPGNTQDGLQAHQGAVLLFEGEHGRLLSVMDATEITAVRTAAVSGVATRVLARPDAADLAILGSGTQARTHLQAMLAVRPIRRIRVWSRRPERAAAFARLESERHGAGVEPVETAKEAVDGADLVCTVTSSSVPVLSGAWLAPGTHVNAVGAVGPGSRELDTQAIVRARLFVDRRESAASEAGEFVLAKKEGAVGDDHIAGEIGEVLTGAIPGRQRDEEITVFRAVGLAIEDLAAADAVYRRAVQDGGGVRIDLAPYGGDDG